MSHTHVSRQMLQTTAFSKDLGGNTVALALVDTTVGTSRNTRGILTTMLQEIQRLVDFHRSQCGLGITELLRLATEQMRLKTKKTNQNSSNTTHVEECVTDNGKYSQSGNQNTDQTGSNARRDDND